MKRNHIRAFLALILCYLVLQKQKKNFTNLNKDCRCGCFQTIAGNGEGRKEGRKEESESAGALLLHFIPLLCIKPLVCLMIKKKKN